jgi:hypothetical protein
MSALGCIYPTWNWCQGSVTRPEVWYVWCIGYVRPVSDLSDLKLVPRFWNPMAISDLVGYIRWNRAYSVSKFPYYQFWWSTEICAYMNKIGSLHLATGRILGPRLVGISILRIATWSSSDTMIMTRKKYPLASYAYQSKTLAKAGSNASPYHLNDGRYCWLQCRYCSGTVTWRSVQPTPLWSARGGQYRPHWRQPGQYRPRYRLPLEPVVGS